jgi:hypothetical protein
MKKLKSRGKSLNTFGVSVYGKFGFRFVDFVYVFDVFQTQRAERDCVNNYRSDQSHTNKVINEYRAIKDLNSHLVELRELLSLRGRLETEVLSAVKSANAANTLSNRGRSKSQENFAAQTMSSTIRYREAISRERFDVTESHEALVNRLINIEKAKQVADAFPSSKSCSAVPEMLKRLDEMKKVVRQEKLRRRVSRKKSKVPEPIIQTVDAPEQLPKKPYLMRKTTPSLPKPPRSHQPLNSVPRRDSTKDISWRDDHSICENVDHDDEVIEAERRDPLKMTERKRAQLAALKLKQNRL